MFSSQLKGGAGPRRPARPVARPNGRGGRAISICGERDAAAAGEQSARAADTDRAGQAVGAHNWANTPSSLALSEALNSDGGVSIWKDTHRRGESESESESEAVCLRDLLSLGGQKLLGRECALSAPAKRRRSPPKRAPSS